GIRGEGEERLAAQAGVVAEAAQRSQALLDLGHQVVGPPAVGECEREAAGAPLASLLPPPRRRLLYPPGEGHRPALGRQRLDHGAPDATAAAGYEDGVCHRRASSRARVTAPAMRRLSIRGR